MAVEIKYNDTTIANVEAGKTATLTCKDKKMKTDIIIAAPVIEDSATPVEVATEDEMATLLETAEVGAIYKYTGETTDTYENGALYVVEEETAYTLGFNISNVDTYTDGASVVIYDGTDATGKEVYNSGGSVSAPTSFWNAISVTIASGNFYMVLGGSKIELNNLTATNVNNFTYTTGAVSTAYVSGEIVGNAIISGSITLDA